MACVSRQTHETKLAKPEPIAVDRKHRQRCYRKHSFFRALLDVNNATAVVLLTPQLQYRLWVQNLQMTNAINDKKT